MSSELTPTISSSHQPQGLGNVYSRKKILLLALVIIAVLGLGLFYAWRASHNGLSTTQYSSAGTGSIRFDKPSSFKPTTEGKQNPNLHYYKQTQSVNGKPASSYLRVLVFPFTADDLSSLENFKAAFEQGPSNADYKTALMPITGFTQNLLNSSVVKYGQINLSAVKPFTNKNISSNAWQFDLTAIKGSNGAVDLQGIAIYAWNTKNIYFYLLAVPKDQWQPNQSTWQSMLNSISLQ